MRKQIIFYETPIRPVVCDVDECLLEDICEDENKKCTNKDGSYECTCIDGFIEENDKCIEESRWCFYGN
jgi:hypothetical protein